ncbi:thiamine-phosphate kinase [Nitrosophilus kaiyonis]|uniref:thiamine-phosphate kinase n=1 Tax=Nitrosophilus kaiyonis TaxID=2930200 RepID=UPI002492BDA8|nr:thiamine-phosphate kinase [Nitrosophilus kaiyonis]
MNKESFFISLFNNKFVGDDAAFLDKYIYSVDAFNENIHFKKEWLSYYEIGQKAMIVNISDAIAMNAKPLYALLSIALPKDIKPYQMEELAKGIKDIANRYKIEIIGGDTISGKKIDISITIISKTKKPIFRKPIKDGYLLAYTGELGRVKKDLDKLLRGKKVGKNSKFKKPILRDKFMQKASRYIKASMDISDGLFDDLGKLSKLNRIGFKFFNKIDKRVGCSGEEYELLFAFDKRDLKKILQISKITRTPITVFAKAVRKPYKNICKPHHF